MTSCAKTFFDYPGAPALLLETMRAAAEKIERRANVDAVTPEALRVDGRVMIAEILAAIDSSTVLAAELGSLNPT